MARLFGYVPNPGATRRFAENLKFPTLSKGGPLLTVDEKKDVVLYPALELVSPKYSRAAQAIGSCTGHGFAACVDLISATQIAVHGTKEDWPGRCLEASIYAFSRVEVAGVKRAGLSDGSYGGACAAAVTRWGCLHYGVDYSGLVFSEYSPSREKTWGDTGVPDSLEKAAKLRRVQTCSLVETFDEFAAACQSGYATSICSNRGFTMTRDSDGHCSPRGSWSHCLCAMGVKFGKRPGALIWNSWGKSNSGPHYSGIPTRPEDMPEFFKGSTFWADADVVEKMLGAGDSWALSNYDGFPSRKMPNWGGKIL